MWQLSFARPPTTLWAQMWLDRYRNKERARDNARAIWRRQYAKHREAIRVCKKESRHDPIRGKNEREYSKQRSRERRQLIASMKDNPCKDCQRRFPSECMDFDHRDGEKKVATISQLLSCSMDKLLGEIAKCDLICANCHRLRTYHRRLSRRLARG